MRHPEEEKYMCTTLEGTSLQNQYLMQFVVCIALPLLFSLFVCLFLEWFAFGFRCWQAKAHESFVKYTLNPFTKIRSKIDVPCEAFDSSIRQAMREYNESIGELEE